MKSKIIYIEDDSRDSNKYKRVLEDEDSDYNGFEIIGIPAQDIVISKRFSDFEQHVPDLFLVDLDLSKQKNNIVFGLSGASTSIALREKFPDIPIVIFTRKDIIKSRFPAIEQTISGVDEIIFKDEIRDDIQKHKNIFIELIRGYRSIRERKPAAFKDILALLNAPSTAFDLIKLADSPLIDKSIPNYLIANWIRNTLLNYPGILYDPIHSATFLGISKEAFLTDGIQEYFRDAEYSGVFRQTEGRWWKSKLNILASNIMNDSEKELAFREGFPLAWERKNGAASLERSKCTFSCESPAEWVCCILKEPMMIKYSLSYRVDSRPKIMDEARVSFKAIKTSNEFKEELIEDPSATKILQGIKKMRLKRC